MYNATAYSDVQELWFETLCVVTFIGCGGFMLGPWVSVLFIVSIQF